MKLGSTASDVLDVLTGKTAVQTLSAVSLSSDTQTFLILFGLGIAAIVLSMKKNNAGVMPGKLLRRVYSFTVATHSNAAWMRRLFFRLHFSIILFYNALAPP